MTRVAEMGLLSGPTFQIQFFLTALSSYAEMFGKFYKQFSAFLFYFIKFSGKKSNEIVKL